MAKRKTPKVKDLRPNKISEEQLGKMRNVVRAINEGQQQLGILESQKHSLLHDVMQLQGVIGKIQQELKEEYGDIDVNINDGTIKYKDSVGQEVYGGHTICDIVEEKDKFSVYIRKNKDVMPWKDFNKNMAVSVEYNLEY